MEKSKKMDILKSALVGGYKGPIFKLIDQAEIEEAQVASTPEQQEEGLSNSPEGTSMSFPNSTENFNTTDMNYPIDIKKFDQGGNLVKSYDNVPPGISDLNMGSEEGMVLETPSKYQKGGFTFNKTNNYSKTNDYSPEAVQTRKANNPYKGMSLSEKVDLGLSTAGMAPGVGIIPDAINTMSNLGQGAYHSLTGNSEQATKDYKNAAWAAAGMVPFGVGQLATATKMGRNAVKMGKNAVKNSKSLYRVVDATGNVQAAKYGSSIPDGKTVGRRTGRQGVIQNNTNFDHISATTDQKWLTEGPNNLFDRYGGDNPYVVKLKGHSGKINELDPSWDGIANSELAKIRPGSYTNMNVGGPNGQNITSILGPKGSTVAQVEDVLSRDEYLKLYNENPDFKWKTGGARNRVKNTKYRSQSNLQVLYNNRKGKK